MARKFFFACLFFLPAIARSTPRFFNPETPTKVQGDINDLVDQSNTDRKSFAVKLATFSAYINNNYLNVRSTSCGAVGNALTDDTSAFQTCLDRLSIGGTLYVPNPSNAYKITSQLTINVNRITILGESRTETLLKYIPTAINTRLFFISGSLDKVTFRNFAVSQSNPGTMTGTSAFIIQTGATKLEWDHVNATRFSRNGINASSGVHYVDIHDCIFNLIRDTTSTSIGIAVRLDGSNVVHMRNNQFSENDKNILIGAGTQITVEDNQMEVDGDSGNINLDYIVQVTGTNDFVFRNNYIEGEYNLNGGAVLYMNNTIDSIVEGNYFQGQDANIDKSSTTVIVRGASTLNPVIRNNKFSEIVSYFVDSDQPVRVYQNSYVDGGVTLTARSSIMPYFATKEMMDIDIADYQTYDPPSLSSGTGTTSASFTVSGSSTGDRVELYVPYDLKGIAQSAYVENSTGSVHIRLNNLTTGTIDLASGSWGMLIRKP